jgi:hypothetical protein
VRLDDPLGQRQSEARAAALRREERLERMFQDVRRHAGPGIGDGHAGTCCPEAVIATATRPWPFIACAAFISTF